jgi:hypothetical protein
MTNPFAPATREAAKARIALCGPAGSGKTYTALTLATALADKVALVDTEHGSASKYAPGKSGDGFVFDTVTPAKFDPRGLAEILGHAAAAGYGAVVVDSLTHYWSGLGGILELVDQSNSGGANRNQFAGWKTVRPWERALIEALLAFPGHVIVTMRTKTEWVIEENDRGKKTPRKVGMKPEQREGIEYEFDIVGDLDQENTLVVTKSRCVDLSNAVIPRPDADLAKQIQDWLDGGVELPDANEYRDKAVEAAADIGTLRALHAEVKRRQMLGAQVENENGDIESLGDLISRYGAEARAAKNGATE